MLAVSRAADLTADCATIPGCGTVVQWDEQIVSLLDAGGFIRGCYTTMQRRFGQRVDLRGGGVGCVCVVLLRGTKLLCLMLARFPWLTTGQ